MDKTCIEVSDAYRRGYSTGLNWTDNYRPGGPWVPSLPVCNVKEKHRAIIRDAIAEREAWLQGFDVGLQEAKSL
jgi:hypothetical protein